MRASLVFLRKLPSLWLVNLVGWLLAGALAIGWLWIPDSSVPGIVWSFVQGAAALVCLLLLPGATLRVLAGAQSRESVSWRGAVAATLKQFLPILVWAAPAAGLCYLLASRLPAWAFGPLILGLILPSLALAALPGVADDVLRRLGATLVTGVVAALAAWALWSWHPPLRSPTGETVSVMVRGGLAYLICVAGWLAAAARVAAPSEATRAKSS